VATKAERERNLAQAQECWLPVFLSTEPADREAAEAAVRELYRLWGHDSPEIVWVRSPVEAMRLKWLYNECRFGKRLQLLLRARLALGYGALFAIAGRLVSGVWPGAAVGAGVGAVFGALLGGSYRRLIACDVVLGREVRAVKKAIARKERELENERYRFKHYFHDRLHPHLYSRLLWLEVPVLRLAGLLAFLAAAPGRFLTGAPRQLEQGERVKVEYGLEAVILRELEVAQRRQLDRESLDFIRDRGPDAADQLIHHARGRLGFEIDRVHRRGEEYTIGEFILDGLGQLRDFSPHQLRRSLFARDVLGVVYSERASAMLDCMARLAENAHFWWLFDGLCVLCERPSSLRLDREGRLHNPTGPALSYRDGLSLYALRGVEVSTRFIQRPESVSPQELLGVHNVEARRVLIELHGWERLLQKLQAELVQEDHFGRLWQFQFEGVPCRVLEVVDATVQPDGSYRHYFLFVPDTLATAHEAVAWTFGIDADRYAPDMQA
jgi:hypothetical protein